MGGKKRPKDPRVSAEETSCPGLDLRVCALGGHRADVTQSEEAMLATRPWAETKPQVS